MEISRIAVIGCGAMGSGIAYTCARFGYTVTVSDMKQEFLDRGMDKIRGDVSVGIDKGKISIKDAEDMVSRIVPELDLAKAVKDADLVIEAIFEDMKVKRELFANLDRHAPKHTILASNTSTLSITKIAEATRRPERVIGMHFFNPVPAMALVEIVMGGKTSEETKRAIEAVTVRIQKKSVICKDSPGFIVNRITAAVVGEGIRLLEQGVASKEDIDKAVMLGLNHPVGPISLADYVGLDVAFNAGKTLHENLGDCYKPSSLLEKMVREGRLGMKNGKGFYEY